MLRRSRRSSLGRGQGQLVGTELRLQSGPAAQGGQISFYRDRRLRVCWTVHARIRT